MNLDEQANNRVESQPSNNFLREGETGMTMMVNQTEYASLTMTREIEVFIMSMLFALTIIGNLIVIFILLFYRKSGKKTFLSRMSFYIIHLSVADISVALMSILPQIIWRNSVVFDKFQALCKFVTFSQVPFFLN